MVFKSNGERYDTSEMLSIELEGNYARMYLHMERGMLFFQTLNDRSGITIENITPKEALMILTERAATNSQDAVTFQLAIDQLQTTARLGPLSKENPEGCMSVQ